MFDRVSSLFHVLPVRISHLPEGELRGRSVRGRLGSSSFLSSFFLSPFSYFSPATSLQLRGKSDYSDAVLKDSAKRDPRMSCCPAVSTDFQRSLTIELPPRDCDLFHIPSLPGRSAPSTGPPCVPSRPHYGRTDLVRAVKQIKVNNGMTIRFLVKVFLKNRKMLNIF